MHVPCRECPDRSAECHAACKRYAEYRAEKDRIHEIRHEELTSAWTEIERYRKQRKDQGWSMKRDQK